MRKTAKKSASAVGDVTPTSSSPEASTATQQATDITPASRTFNQDWTQDDREATHAAVCEIISTGIPSTEACRKAGVARGTWLKWMNTGLVDGQLYSRAREMCADVLAEGIIAVADDRLYDPNERRVMVDARKWVAGRMFPRNWGDKVDVTSDGKSIGPIAALPASVLITEDDHGAV